MKQEMPLFFFFSYGIADLLLGVTERQKQDWDASYLIPYTTYSVWSFCISREYCIYNLNV